MIVIGSYAAELNGIPLRKEINDIDIYGSVEDLGRFRAENGDRIISEKQAHGTRTYFGVRDVGSVNKVEFDCGRSPSDLLLEELAPRTTGVLNSEVKLAPPNVLYLIKRAHATRPVHFDKTADDLLALAPHITEFTADERRYYDMLRRESDEKLATQRAKFAVGVHDDDLLRMQGAAPIWRHMDVLRAIAAEPSPAHVERKGPPPLDLDIFGKLDFEQKLVALREVFMAAGIERIYAFRPNYTVERIYRRGMRKVMRDLLPVPLQDFCIDNLLALSRLADPGFLARFQAALNEGKVATVERAPAPLGPAHKAAWEVLVPGADMRKARGICEDLVRRSDLPGDAIALHILGLIYSKGEKQDMAEQCFRKSLYLRRQNPRAWGELGAFLRARGKYVDAKHCLTEAIQQGSSNAELLMELGRTNEALGARDDARAAYAAALKLKPKLTVARERLDALGG